MLISFLLQFKVCTKINCMEQNAVAPHAPKLINYEGFFHAAVSLEQKFQFKINFVTTEKDKLWIADTLCNVKWWFQ